MNANGSNYQEILELPDWLSQIYYPCRSPNGESIAYGGTEDNESGISILDDLNNPGNLGTIIRLCDWFGILDLVCSPATVDCYNPKVVQSAMGSHTRVNITYSALEPVLSSGDTLRSVPPEVALGSPSSGPAADRDRCIPRRGG